MRIRVTGNISDPDSIDVYDCDTGKQLTNVVSIDIRIERNVGACYVKLDRYDAKALSLVGECTLELSDIEETSSPVGS